MNKSVPPACTQTLLFVDAWLTMVHASSNDDIWRHVLYYVSASIMDADGMHPINVVRDDNVRADWKQLGRESIEEVTRVTTDDVTWALSGNWQIFVIFFFFLDFYCYSDLLWSKNELPGSPFWLICRCFSKLNVILNKNQLLFAEDSKVCSIAVGFYESTELAQTS